MVDFLSFRLVYHRNGVTYLEDVKGFSFGNYDTKIARDMNNSVQVNCFFLKRMQTKQGINQLLLLE